MTIVAIDASYTDQMITDVVVLAPGQTTDVLLTADQPPAYYYMAARGYASSPAVPIDNTTTTGIISYQDCKPSTPLMPDLPPFNDTDTVFKFSNSLSALENGPHWVPVPAQVDEYMFVTLNLGLLPCEQATCAGPLGLRIAASMNNESFTLPTKSMLHAFYNGESGIYTTDFPDQPPLVFDYTNPNNSAQFPLVMTSRSTKVKQLKFNSTVEIVLQNTALLATESHPIHLHGFNFYVLAQGFGNYDPINDPKNFNLVNPQIRNNIGVPVGGWAVIRFQANNPGIVKLYFNH